MLVSLISIIIHVFKTNKHAYRMSYMLTFVTSRVMGFIAAINIEDDFSSPSAAPAGNTHNT